MSWRGDNKGLLIRTQCDCASRRYGHVRLPDPNDFKEIPKYQMQKDGPSKIGRRSQLILYRSANSKR